MKPSTPARPASPTPRATSPPESPFRGRGVGATREEALENTCWHYCYEADAAFDGKYSVWFDAKANDSHKKNFASDRSKGKRMGITTDPGLKQEFMACVATCLGNVASQSAGLSATVDCGD